MCLSSASINPLPQILWKLVYFQKSVKRTNMQKLNEINALRSISYINIVNLHELRTVLLEVKSICRQYTARGPRWDEGVWDSPYY